MLKFIVHTFIYLNEHTNTETLNKLTDNIRFTSVITICRTFYAQ